MVFAPVATQDVTIPDTLSWFPGGNYLTVAHTDIQRIKEEELYAGLAEFINARALQSCYNRMPPSLAEDCTSSLIATRPEYDFDREKGIMKTVSSEKLGVIRFPDAMHALAVATKAGEMSPTGEIVLGREVFAFFNPKDEKQYLAVVGIQEELLFAESTETLEMMILAGTGQALQMLDSEDYLDLPDLIPEDALQWTILLQATRNNELIRRLRRSGAEEEKIKQLTERYASGTQYRISTFSMGEQLISRYIIVTGDSDYEEKVQRGETMKAYEVLDRSTPVRARYHDLRTARTTETYEGNKIIYTTVFDSELIEAEMEYRKEREAEEAAKQAEEEKKDK